MLCDLCHKESKKFFKGTIKNNSVDRNYFKFFTQLEQEINICEKCQQMLISISQIPKATVEIIRD
jgi:hypothetical protein